MNKKTLFIRLLWLIAFILSLFPPAVIVKAYVERNFNGSKFDLIFSIFLWFAISSFCIYKTLSVKGKKENKNE